MSVFGPSEVYADPTASGSAVDGLKHGIDVTEAVSIGLIVALGIILAAGDVVGINAVTIARVLEGLQYPVEVHISFIGQGLAEAVASAEEVAVVNQEDRIAVD